MDGQMSSILLRSEAEFSEWFMKNYGKLGYEKILRKDIGKFPDFIMLKNGKEILVELETLLSNFILHKHDQNKVDEIVCIKNDLKINQIKVPIIEVEDLEYLSKTSRISATIDEKTEKKLDEFLKKSRYRNKSHIIEEAIDEFISKGGKK